MRIDAERPEAAEAYRTLAALVLAHGGSLHPALVLHQRSEALWVSVDGMAEGDPEPPLIQIPTPLLIPIEGLEWGAGPVLEVACGLDRLTAAQREALAAMLTLYRVTGKLVWARRHLPAAALAGDDPLARLLSRAQPGPARWGVSPATAFVRSRSLVTRGGDDGPAPLRRPVLMPLADGLDHHPAGARLQVRPEGLRVRLMQPVPGGACHACYGYKDALRLLLGYGYLDTQTRFVHCLPTAIGLTPLGQLQVAGIGHRAGQDLPAVTARVGGLGLGHLNFDADRPQRALELLRVVIGGLPLSLPAEAREDLARAAHTGLLGATRDYYRELAECAAAGDDSPVRVAVIAAAARQQELLREVAGADG